MDCECHGEPMLWNRDSRYTAGGFWYCVVKSRTRSQRWYANPENAARKQERQRQRYDADPIHRIGKRLHDDSRRRAERIARRKEALAHGQVSR